jgi:hypothetical protein
MFFLLVAKETEVILFPGINLKHTLSFTWKILHGLIVNLSLSLPKHLTFRHQTTVQRWFHVLPLVHPTSDLTHNYKILKQQGRLHPKHDSVDLSRPTSSLGHATVRRRKKALSRSRHLIFSERREIPSASQPAQTDNTLTMSPSSTLPPPSF